MPNGFRLLLIGALTAAVTARAADPKPLEVLLVAGGCCHDYATQTKLLEAGIEARVRANVTVAYNPDTSTKARFDIYEQADWAEPYDVIIHDECSADVTDGPYVARILAAHRAGKPAVNIHCAMHSYRWGDFRKPVAAGADNAGWYAMIGVQSTGHGPQLPIAVAYQDHPITKGLADWTTINEELYNNVQVLPSAKPLARGVQALPAPKGQPDAEPGAAEAVVAWTNEYGPNQTRIFSTSLGHNNDTVGDDRYLDLVCRGLLWATGRLAADGTPAAGYSLEPAAAADVLYSGGVILTMRGPEPEYVESLVVRDGKILFVGPLVEARTLVGPGTTTVDLAGKTLLPGFIDTHGHFIYFGKNLVDADLFGCADVADLVARMRKQALRTPADGWIVGFGYQARGMKEGRPPTSAELDQISADRPVMVVDSSGHLGAANAAAFQAAGITADTPDPTGGMFARGPDGRSLLGPMEETALNAVRSKRPPFTGELAARAVTGAAEVWASHGQTTAMEAGLGLGNDDIGIVLEAIDKQLLPIDLYVAAKDSALDDSLAAAYAVASQYDPQAGGIVQKLRAARPDLDRRYVNRVRLGGVKFWLDGSLDTAWFTQPYTQNPPGKSGAFAGYRQIPDEVLDAVFEKYWPTDLQIHMHMNGDAAADQALAAIAKAVEKHGMRDHRPVFVHASWLRGDQIEKMKACGAIPSFLTAGIIPGGDAVVKLWGPERSAGAMASRSFLRAGLPFTYSHDAPVSPVPSILALVDAGVNRRSGSGQVVGPDERIPPYAALRAVTATAAYQLKEEATKGTLEPGKLADLVILDRNPLEGAPTTIKDIVVVETIKDGRTVFAR